MENTNTQQLIPKQKVQHKPETETEFKVKVLPFTITSQLAGEC